MKVFWTVTSLGVDREIQERESLFHITNYKYLNLFKWFYFISVNNYKIHKLYNMYI